MTEGSLADVLSNVPGPNVPGPGPDLVQPGLVATLLDKYKSDKNTYHSYGHIYDELFKPYQFNAEYILELGVLDGASLRAWAEYFTDATIVGFDLEANIFEDRIYTIAGDQKNIEVLYGKLLSLQFDIIIDDCTHDPYDQVVSLVTLKPLLKKGGLYVIEDVKTPEVAKVLASIMGEHSQVIDLTSERTCPDNRLVVCHDPR